MKKYPFTTAFYKANRTKLAKLLQPRSLAFICSNDEMPRNGDQFFPFRQQSDLLYLTGIAQEKTMLVICPDHPLQKYREVLFAYRPEETMDIWYGPKYTASELKEISGINTIVWLEDAEAVIKEMVLACERIYLDQNEHPKFFTEVPTRDIRFAQKIRQDYPAHGVERLAPLITGLRLIKQSQELDVMAEAIDITRKAFLRVLQETGPGMKEYVIEAAITHTFTVSGAQGHAYSPIVASGKNACILHYCTNRETCKDGDLLLLDFGAEYANYAADLSRTIPVNGKFTERQKDVYEAVLTVQKAAIKLMVVGRTIDQLNAGVGKQMEKQLIRLGLLKPSDVHNQDPSKPLYSRYFMHGTSHFIGLDVHDAGEKQTTFKPGMVLSCEPGIYIPEENLGIRLENDILITSKGAIDLMKEIPIVPSDIEILMKTKTGKTGKGKNN